MTSTAAPAKLARSMARRDEPGQHRLEPVVVAVMEMVGLGRREQDAVDPPGDQPASQPARPSRKAERISASAVSSAATASRPAFSASQHVDQHDLAIEPGEVIAEERPDHGRLIGLVAALIMAASEPARIAPSPISSGEKVSAGEPSRSPGIRKRPGGSVERLVPPARTALRYAVKSAASSRASVSSSGACGSTPARRASHRPRQRRRPGFRAAASASPRPGRVILRQERQVEKPLAGIVDDIEIEPAAPDGAGEKRGRFELDGQPELADLARRIGPDPLLDEGADMSLVIEAGHRVVGLRLEPRAGDAAAGIGLEQRQPAAMDEIVDERRDENGLAGAGEAGHAEAERRRPDPDRPLRQRRDGEPGLVGDGGQLHAALAPDGWVRLHLCFSRASLEGRGQSSPSPSSSPVSRSRGLMKALIWPECG